MQPPALLWPLPWWTVVLVITLLLGLVSLAAIARVKIRNRHLKMLRHQLRELDLPLGNTAFSIGEGKNVLVVDSDSLAVADLKYWRIAQTLTLDRAISLKIYEDANRIEFRVVTWGGAQTRRVSTWSIAGFGKLFILFTKTGKHVEYVVG